MINYEHYLKLYMIAGVIYFLFTLRGLARFFKWHNKFDYRLYGYLNDLDKSVPHRIAILISNLSIIFLILVVYELLTGSPLPLDNIYK